MTKEKRMIVLENQIKQSNEKVTEMVKDMLDTKLTMRKISDYNDELSNLSDLQAKLKLLIKPNTRKYIDEIAIPRNLL